jgi:hypothetical protein
VPQIVAILKVGSAVSDFHDPDDSDETEFGLGPGMIDPMLRSNRALSVEQQLQEIYATPKTFDSAANNIPLGDPETTPVPRLLPGEPEADRG